MTACIRNGYKRGILPVGQGFKAYEGTTCTCHEAGDPILCVMDSASDYSDVPATNKPPSYGPTRSRGRNNRLPLYNDYGTYGSDYGSSQQYSDDSAGAVNQTQFSRNTGRNQARGGYYNYDYGDYYQDYVGYPSFTQYDSYGSQQPQQVPLLVSVE